MTPEDKVIIETLHLNGANGDIAYTAIIRAKAHWVDFSLHEACSWGDDGPLYDSPCEKHQPFGAPLAEADPLFTGYVKWDGCSEGEWSDNQKHVCSGAESYAQRFDAVLWMLGEARRLMLAAGGSPEWTEPARGTRT